MKMPKPKKPTPYDILGKPSDLQARNDLATELCRDIEDAFNARASIIADGGLIDYANWFYEQGKSNPDDLPYPGAADLTSPLITQDVDALRARLVKAVFGVRPFAFAEAWGKDASKAPYVEAFIDWQARKSDFKLEVAKVIHGALLEDAHVLEVSEKIETRRISETIQASVEATDEGAVIFSADGKPTPKRDEMGEPIPPQMGPDGQPTEAYVTAQRSYTKTKRMGPQYDPISMKDFVFLPGHAKSRKDVWGYAYKFVKRVPELAELVSDGVYDADAVDRLADHPETDESRKTTAVDTVVANPGDSAEKELVQVCLKRDLDGDGREEWYVATLSLRSRELLRLKIDSFAQKYGRWRCVPCVLFPRHNSVYGYSFAFCKLLTNAEEHSALRNTRTDRMTLAANAPMTRLTTAIWDPDAQPIGAGRVIDVRQHNEVQLLQIPDVPTSLFQGEAQLLGFNERLSGLSDQAIAGVTSEDRRTATENKIVAGGSGVRVDEIVGYLHAFIAEVLQVSLAIWIDTLEADKQGLDAPASVAAGLKQAGSELPGGKFTVEMLKGDFQFEPYGSDETADPMRRRTDFNNKFVALANLGKVFPALQLLFQSPDAAKAVVEEWARAYGVKDTQPFLGAMQAPQIPQTTNPMGPGPMGAQPPGGMPGGAGLPPEIMALLNGVSAEGQPGGAAY